MFFNLNGLLCRSEIEAGNLRVVAVNGHLVFEVIDQIKCVGRGSDGIVVGTARNGNLKRGRHRPTRNANECEFARRNLRFIDGRSKGCDRSGEEPAGCHLIKINC